MINKPELTLCTVNKRQPDGLPRTASYTEMEDRLNESMQCNPLARTSWFHMTTQESQPWSVEWDLQIMMEQKDNECKSKKCFMSLYSSICSYLAFDIRWHLSDH